jgi:hypothetical protein
MQCSLWELAYSIFGAIKITQRPLCKSLEPRYINPYIFSDYLVYTLNPGPLPLSVPSQEALFQKSPTAIVYYPLNLPDPANGGRGAQKAYLQLVHYFHGVVSPINIG